MMQTSTSSRVRRYPYQITLSLVLKGFYSPSAPSYDFCLVLLPTLFLIDLVPIKFSLHVTIGIGEATPFPIFFFFSAVVFPLGKSPPALRQSLSM